MLDCRVFAGETEPLYVDIAVARWEQFAGRKAVKARSCSPQKLRADRRRRPGWASSSGETSGSLAKVERRRAAF